MNLIDTLLLLLTALVGGAAVYWACHELGGVVQWFVDGDDSLAPSPLLAEADRAPVREGRLSPQRPA